MKYSKKDIIIKVNKALEKPDTLYTQNFINYVGKVNTHQYTEIISKELLKYENLSMLTNMNPISRESSYYVTKPLNRIKPINTNREEEWIAINLTTKTLPYIGKVIDYQIPLKNTQKDKIGKIDLLSYNEKTNTMYILELKKPNSTETLLRCILEAYTYWSVVDKYKLLKDFSLANANLRAAVLIYEDCKAYRDYISKDNKYVRELMSRLDVDLFILNTTNDKITKKQSQLNIR